MAKISKAQLQREIKALKEENQTLESSLKDQEQSFVAEKENIKKEHKEQLKQKEEAHETKINELESRIEELEKQNKEKQRQIDKRELKKLAEAYKEQEDEYSNDVKKWFKYVVGSFLVLFVTVGASIIYAGDKAWYERLEVYIINFVAITLLVFSLKQFSYYVKLKTDFANRKTLAQSYHNILGEEENTEIRTKFLEKAAEVLTAKSEPKHDSYTLPEKLLETLGDIAKTLSKKL